MRVAPDAALSLDDEERLIARAQAGDVEALRPLLTQFSDPRRRRSASAAAQFMDKPNEGALGGTAFRYFRITVDYPNATAVFEKP